MAYNLTMHSHLNDSSTLVQHPVDSSQYKQIMMAASGIQRYYLWIIFTVGVPGNIASLVTVLKMKPLTSVTAYVATLAVVDLLAILVKLLLLVFQVHSIDIQSWGCKFMIFFGNFLVSYASWILVAMAAERYAAVWFPLIVCSVWKCSKSVISLCVMCVIIMGIFLHLLWTIESNSGKCQLASHYLEDFFIIKVWYWINATVYAFLPCACLFVFNILIIIGIRKSAVEQQSLTPRGNFSKSSHDVSIMLIVVSIVFLILTTPRSILLLFAKTWNPTKHTLGFAVKELLSQISFVLCDSNHAINFILYFLSVRRFREKAMKLFACRNPRTNIKRTNLLLMHRGRSSTRCHHTYHSDIYDTTSM